MVTLILLDRSDVPFSFHHKLPFLRSELLSYHLCNGLITHKTIRNFVYLLLDMHY
jgi:hypothetical protein